MKGLYDETIKVCETDLSGGAVSVTVEEDGVAVNICLAPAKARKFARKLNKAADTVEGVEPVRDAYVLRLTEDQAKTLRVILGRIGGTFGSGYPGQTVTARKYADEVYYALADAGVPDADGDPRFAIDEAGDRAIYFIGVAE